MDKAFWNAIVEKDYAVPDDHTVEALTPTLLEFLGSTDIEVRDPFGYMIFAHWMVRDKHYSPDELRTLRDKLLANTQVGLGENGTDSVFLRSFSILVLSLVMYYDLQAAFLTQDEVKSLLEHTLNYFKDEQDLRGYVTGKGWAHSCAHTADVLKFIARSPMTDASDHERILNAMVDKLTLPVTYKYVHSEDERLALAVLDVLKRETLSMDAWQTWLHRFTEWKQSWPQDADFTATVHAPWFNCKSFLRSLYFRLELVDDLPEPATELKSAVREVINVFGQW